MSNFFILLLLIKFQFNICGYLFVSKIFFLSYSFVMFRIDFILSIWINLHICIDIVFVGLVFKLKFLPFLLLLLYIANKTSLFFWEKSKLQPMSSSLGNDKFLFDMLYINLMNLIWFWSKIWKFYKFEVLSLGVLVFVSQ